MKSQRIVLSIASATLLAISSAHADILSHFDFQSAWTGSKTSGWATFSGNAPSVDTDVNTTTSLLSNNGFNSGGYLSYSLKDSVAGTAIFSTSATPDVGLNFGGAQSTSPLNYFSFTVTPDSGYQTTYETFSLYSDAAVAAEQYNIELRAVDGGGAETVMGPIHSHTSVGVNDPVHLVTFDFADFTSANTTEWRIYAYNATSTVTGIRFDDIQLTGTTVPEPGMISLIALASGLIIFVRHRFLI